ncbi:MAG TPA: DUF2911 domain-containing protein [Candidatus Limnocylindrales bacterium]|nr:DUF2911 domain-containing protein [Candidatus Limnocylindrales bacterium]
MRISNSILLLAVLATAAFAQGGKAPASPAETASVTVNGKQISIKYSAPSVRGRTIWGPDGILAKDPTAPVWRAGANNATALHTDADLTIGNLSVPKGDYTLYIQPTPGAFELIVNKQTGQWGTTYEKSQDLGRVPMKTGKTSAPVEQLKYTLTANGNRGTLTMEWENVSASVPFTVK